MVLRRCYRSDHEKRRPKTSIHQTHSRLESLFARRGIAMPVGTQELYDEALESLTRMQKFDVNSLPREGELGRELNFTAAVEPARLLVELHKRLSVTALDDFPDHFLTIVRDNANNHFQLFTQASEFSVAQQDPNTVRQSIVKSMTTAYQPAFIALSPLVSYSLHRSADFQRLDSEARATLQSIEDRANEFAEEMEQHGKDAKRILEEIRNVAAEEGVTQQAAHFRAESIGHETQAEIWRKRITKLAWTLGSFAVVSLFIHKIPVLAPKDIFDSVQLGISKVLIFSVIAYMLFLSARNFLNHKHNAIVNKHRQNALMTHRALVEAATESGVREAIMLQAASCIFSPQATGYAQVGGDSDGAAPKSMVEILSKPLSDAVKPSS